MWSSSSVVPVNNKELQAPIEEEEKTTAWAAAPVEGVEIRREQATQTNVDNADPGLLLCQTLYALWPVIALCVVMTIMSIIFRNAILELCIMLDEMDRVSGLFLWLILFVVWVLCWLPTTVLELVSGFMFGIWWGMLANATGKTVSGVTTFIAGRYLFKDYFTREITEKNIVFYSLSKLLEEREWYTVHLILLSYLNYSMKTYGLGTMPVSFPAFVVGAINTGLIFGFFAATIGSGLRDLSEAADGGGGMTTESIVMLVLGCGASVVCIIYISIYTRRELDRMTKTITRNM